MLWGGGGGGGGPNKKMGVNQWEWDTCPILEHFRNIKLIGETLFPWVWPDREKMEKKRKREKRKRKKMGKKNRSLLGLVPHHFASNIARFVANEQKEK